MLFFDDKRKQVDEFMANEWIPLFAKNVFETHTVEANWNEIVASDDTKERLDFIVQMGTGMQNKINQKRLELMAPLDAIEKELEQEIRDSYNSVKSANNAITSYLNSAVKVDEKQDEIPRDGWGDR